MEPEKQDPSIAFFMNHTTFCLITLGIAAAIGFFVTLAERFKKEES